MGSLLEVIKILANGKNDLIVELKRVLKFLFINLEKSFKNLYKENKILGFQN